MGSPPERSATSCCAVVVAGGAWQRPFHRRTVPLRGRSRGGFRGAMLSRAFHYRQLRRRRGRRHVRPGAPAVAAGDVSLTEPFLACDRIADVLAASLRRDRLPVAFPES